MITCIQSDEARMRCKLQEDAWHGCRMPRASARMSNAAIARGLLVSACTYKRHTPICERGWCAIDAARLPLADTPSTRFAACNAAQRVRRLCAAVHAPHELYLAGF